ncbi:hypothetical protein [Peribacillus simplex]|uniref:PglD-related sugar-binding protein n=1 Tax=Peribacillus simplex TaxID=1478 RepID=UPI00338E4648
MWGCGGHAREINHLCENLYYEVIGFLDERSEINGIIIDDVPVLGVLHDIYSLLNKIKNILCWCRRPLSEKAVCPQNPKCRFGIADTLVHPSVYISKRNYLS